MELDIEQIVRAMGGATAIASRIGVPRQAPYRWIKNKYVSSKILEKIKNTDPNFNIDHYFTGGTSDERKETWR